MTRVNLGCGRRPLDGFINVDRNDGAGVDIVADAEKDLLFADNSVDLVHCDHFLEHPVDFESVMREIWRILKPGGRLEASVPYGFNCNPYHRRYFDEKAVRTIVNPSGCADGFLDAWALVSMRISARGFPWWHVRKYLGREIPIGRKLQLTFVLEKVAHQI